METIDERIAFLEAHIKLFKDRITAAKHDYHELIRLQGEAERELFKAQFEKRRPNG